MDNKINEIIEYKDAKNVKLSYTIDDEDDNLTGVGQYLINGRRYSVLREDGNLTYMDMDKAEKESDKLTKDLNLTKGNCNSAITKPFFKVLNKGKEKIVSGIKGEIWEVESEEDGEKYKEKIVVTNNKELVDAMSKSFEILQKFGEGPYGREIGADVKSMMFVEQGYVLISAEGIKYQELHNDKIPDGTIKLPIDAVDSMANFTKFTDEEREEGKKLFKEALEFEEDEICIADK
jgi:hypothetical protein